MKHFICLFFFCLMILCGFTNCAAQIDANSTPDWVQRLKRKPLNEFAHSSPSPTQPLLLQGKQYNPTTGNWDWVKTNLDSLSVFSGWTTEAVIENIRSSNLFWLGDYQSYADRLFLDNTIPPSWANDDALSIYKANGWLFLEPGYLGNFGVNSQSTIHFQTTDIHGNGNYRLNLLANIIKKDSLGNTFFPSAQKLFWLRGRVSSDTRNVNENFGFYWQSYGNALKNSWVLETTTKSGKQASLSIDTLGQVHIQSLNDADFIAVENGILTPKEATSFQALPSPDIPVPLNSTDMSGVLASIPVGWTGVFTIENTSYLYRKASTTAWHRLAFAEVF